MNVPERFLTDDPVPARWPRWLAWAAGGVALFPLLFLFREFSRLFWFGDEWDLLDQIWRTGFWDWTWQAFAENFVPLFKLLWFGLVVLGQGDYRVMVVALWLTHAVNVALLGLVLRQSRLSWWPTLLCLLVFGLTPANLETLGWSVQWSAVLATTFFLWGAWWYNRYVAHDHRWSAWRHGVLFALCAASALSFSRGVLTGSALAAVALWPVARTWTAQGGARLRTALICFVPGLAVAILITITQPGGNHRHLGLDDDRLYQMARYALWYFGMNPFHRLLEVDLWGWRTTALLTLGKLALIAWCLRHARGDTLRNLVLLLLFDLGNAVLLGLGRYHTGLETANSSRYQYASLIATLPFVAFALEQARQRMPLRNMRREVLVGAALLLVVLGLVVRNWPREIRHFAHPRGQYTRDLLFDQANPPAEGAIPGIAFLSTERAQELVEHYDLH